MRTLLVLIAVVAVVLILRTLWRRRGERGNAGPPAARTVDSVQCRHCGLHLPRADAIYRAPDYFCCRDHLEQNRH